MKMAKSYYTAISKIYNCYCDKWSYDVHNVNMHQDSVFQT